MSAPDAPPPIPTEFQIYNSYVEDPKWQRKFTAIWAAAVGVAIIATLPHLLKSIRNGFLRSSLIGVREDWDKHYERVASGEGSKKPIKSYSKTNGLATVVKSLFLWSVPYVGLDVGQVLLVVAYYAVLLCCITIQAPLVDNPNRAGFLALAQLPVVFLFATKNSLLSLALGAGHGWEKINFLHRWSGRGMFLAAGIHGSLWIRNHLQYGLPIIGQQKEGSGVASFGLLCVLVLSSLRPVRVWAYQAFFYFHVLGYCSFFISVCYHTIYASPWIFPPMAFYGLDLLLRMIRVRVKDASLHACDNQMTVIEVNDSDTGWAAGQHVRLRVFFNGRILESHPLTILSAPSKTSCLSRGRLILGARVQGDWTRALNKYAKAHSMPAPTIEVHEAEKSKSEDVDIEVIDEKRNSVASVDTESVMVCDAPDWTLETGAPVQVMLDGPYGGSSVDLGDFKSVFLVAGGSGITFTLGMLDDIVGRCVKLGRQGGERTRRIEFAWCIKSYACMNWFSPMLIEIARAAKGSSIDLHISIYVTCLCNPEAVPNIPNCDVSVERPTVHRLLNDFVSSAGRPEFEESGKGKSKGIGGEGGLAVCVAGPEAMTRETKNGVARLTMSRGMELGRVACHTELYSL